MVTAMLGLYAAFQLFTGDCMRDHFVYFTEPAPQFGQGAWIVHKEWKQES